MSIPSIPNTILKYLRRFDLSSIAQSRDGRLAATRNPENYQHAWWCNSVDVGRVIKHARRNGGDVPAAARALRVRLAPHDFVMQNTEKIVAKLDARLASAQQSGNLKSFNVAYANYRRAKFVAGQPAMGYSASRSRLRAALSETAAGQPPVALFRRVFEPERG
jgi:hypothetical protein